MNWGDGFAEGDSGFFFPQINDENYQAQMIGMKVENLVYVSREELFGKIIGLAIYVAERERKNSRECLDALDVVLRAVELL